MAQMFQFLLYLFKMTWNMLTGYRFFGVSPLELSFACMLIIFVVRKIIKPVFGGSDDDK